MFCSLATVRRAITTLSSKHVDANTMAKNNMNHLKYASIVSKVRQRLVSIKIASNIKQQIYEVHSKISS